MASPARVIRGWWETVAWRTWRRGQLALLQFSAGQVPTRPIFISYAREDRHISDSVVNLFRVTHPAIFRDVDSIKPGDNWREAIAAAIRDCEAVLVLWCTHASRSYELQIEYELALSIDARVVPVLMDSTPLPPLLAVRQGVDLRPALGEHRSETIERRVHVSTVVEGGGVAVVVEERALRPSSDRVVNAAAVILQRVMELTRAC